jgi:hypothetical protein
MNICQNLWPHFYRKLPKGFPQDLAYILNRVGRIFWPKKIVSEWPPFSNWPLTKSAKFQCSLISMKIYILFSSPGHRPCELLSWVSVRRSSVR